MFFSRSRGTLALDGRRVEPLVVIVAGLLLAIWAAWFFKARVAVYAVSESARLETDRSPFPVQTVVGGRVVSSALEMGSTVRAGDVLVELDVRAERLAVDEERTRLSGHSQQIERLLAEFAEQANSRQADQAAASAALAEAHANYEEAAAAADFAASNEARVMALANRGLIQQAELVRTQSETKQKRAAAEGLRLAVERLRAESQRTDTEYRIKIERLEREAAALRSQVRTASAAVERLEHQGDLRRIVAPADGTLAEVATLRPGQVLDIGATVATVIPSGDLRLVASFLPAEAFGRVRAGQPARLRLDGFPPTQYGGVLAIVSSVASEVRDGRVRVELALTHRSLDVPMQHGLPGSVEVEVERISPASLVLRAAGLSLRPQGAARLPAS